MRIAGAGTGIETPKQRGATDRTEPRSLILEPLVKPFSGEVVVKWESGRYRQ
jgi:hypothetical protein